MTTAQLFSKVVLAAVMALILLTVIGVFGMNLSPG